MSAKHGQQKHGQQKHGQQNMASKTWPAELGQPSMVIRDRRDPRAQENAIAPLAARLPASLLQMPS